MIKKLIMLVLFFINAIVSGTFVIGISPVLYSSYTAYTSKVVNQMKQMKIDLVNAIHEKTGLTKSTGNTSYGRSVYVDPSIKDKGNNSTNQTGDNVITKSTMNGSKDQDKYVARVMRFSIERIKKEIRDTVSEIKEVKIKLDKVTIKEWKKELMKKYSSLINKLEILKKVYDNAVLRMNKTQGNMVKSNLVLKYKTLIIKKLSTKINNFSLNKLKKIKNKIESAKKKILLNNTKINDTQKIKILSAIEALDEVISERLEKLSQIK